MKKINVLACAILLLLFSFCSNNPAKSSMLITDDISTLKNLTRKWNESLVKRDIQSLRTLYAEKVNMYGATLSKEQVALIKSDFLQKYADFTQLIAGEINVTKVSDQEYKVVFPKHSSFSGKTSDVQAYLLFSRIADNWKISTESDDLTDKNLNKPKPIKNVKIPATCLDAVMQILCTSPAYKRVTNGLAERIVKNGGTGYGIMIEGSPFPDRDDALQYSETYDFKLYESYEDRAPVVERFTFDPQKRQLYLYEVVENELVPVEFDRKLLPIFEKMCDERLVKKISMK